MKRERFLARLERIQENPKEHTRLQAVAHSLGLVRGRGSRTRSLLQWVRAVMGPVLHELEDAKEHFALGYLTGVDDMLQAMACRMDRRAERELRRRQLRVLKKSEGVRRILRLLHARPDLPYDELLDETSLSSDKLDRILVILNDSNILHAVPDGKGNIKWRLLPRGLALLDGHGQAPQ